MSIGSTNRHAPRLRRDATDAETRLWRHLRNRQLGGLKLRRQATVGPYVVDFLCTEKRLIVELDGGQHSEEADEARSAKLESLGYRLVRFWNSELNADIESVLERILAEASARPSHFEPRQPSSNSD